MERLDRWSALFWIMISIGICAHSVSLGVGSFREPGVGFLFFWTGAALGVLSLLLLFKGWQGRKKIESRDDWESFKQVDWLKVVSVLTALVVYAFLFEWIGALISTVVFVGFLMQIIEPKKWYVLILLSLASSLSIYVLFKVLLNVRLPSGFLSF